MKIHTRRLFQILVCLLSFTSFSVRAEYGTFTDVPGGSDIVMKELRWPYWNSGYYNTWFENYWTSSDGVGGYFYNGLPLPPSGSPTTQTINWSFWPLSNPLNFTDLITPYYTSPDTFARPSTAEGTILEVRSTYPFWQTNVWYRVVYRVWPAASGAPNLCYAGSWVRDPVAGAWYCLGAMQLPFAATGIDGSSTFQENASGNQHKQETDYRRSYYHIGGAWHSSTNWSAYVNSDNSTEDAGLLTNSVDGTNGAVYYIVCQTNNLDGFVGTLSHGMTSPTYDLVQPSSPPLDPILVTDAAAVLFGNQLVVQWQVPSNSSPQFAYRVNVFTNASYTGNVVASTYNIAPEVRQVLLTLSTAVTPYPQLTIIDVMNQTNAPINLTVSNATLSAAFSVPGAVNGLAYSYYQSPSDNVVAPATNWTTMPNFSLLTPVSSGVVNGLDLTPRQRRQGYAFDYTGYLNAPSNGLYAFTLTSCDGGMLYVDGQLVVNWNGDHSASDLSGWMGLQAGLHTVNVQYYCDVQPAVYSGYYDYYDALSLAWAGPGFSQITVPPSAFYYVPSGGQPTITLSSPTNGATIPGASVPWGATVVANGDTLSSVQYYVDGWYWGQSSVSPYNLNSFLWASATNVFAARLLYNGSNTVDSAPETLITTNMTLAPWQDSQVFFHYLPSGASIQNGAYSLIGDGVNLLTRQVQGDCTLIAHLNGMTPAVNPVDGSSANPGWQAGIILRGTTNLVPGYPWGQSGTAPFVALFGQLGGGSYYQDEDMVNGGGGYSRGVTSGNWFKLVRTNGTNFTSFVSSDGANWTQVGNTNLTDFNPTLYAGLFTCADPSSNPNIPAASFNDVSLTGDILGPPGVSVNPQTDAVYAGQNLTLTATPSGNAPFSYQWQFNQVDIADATNATLSLANLQPSSSGMYTVALVNSNGIASATATLTVLTPSLPVATILSNNPIGYWRLDETAGPTAYDSMGNYNGTGQGDTTFGVPGVNGAPFTGFETGNLGARFGGDSAPSDISIPAFNVTTTNFTITGWVNCDGTQDSWSGLVFSRGSGHGVGMMVVNNGGNELRYSWNDNGNDYNASTGFKMPSGQWVFAALTITPSNAIIYFATNATLQSWTNTTANLGQTFSGNFYFGCDPNSLLSGLRQFNGTLDEIAIWNQTLTRTQIGQILSASQTATPPSVILTAPASGANFGVPATINLTADVVTNGHSITGVQFYNGGTLLGQATTAPYSYTWSNIPVGTYSLYAQITYDSGSAAYSAPAFVTVNPLPSAPAAITPTALSGNLIGITWPPGANSTGYILSRNGVAITTLSGTNYLDLGLTANTTYSYYVVATSAYGNSAPSVTNSATTPASGMALWWDANGSPIGPQDGSANWGSSAGTWWNGSANTTWSNDDLAIIGNGATSPYFIQLTNSVNSAGLIFNANNGGNYSVSGSNLTLSGSAKITANDNAAISSVLAGSLGMTKTGPGTLLLSANETYTGGTIVTGGTLKLNVGGSSGTLQGALTINPGGTVECAVNNALGWSGANWVRNITINGGTLLTDVASDNGWGTTIGMTAGTMRASVPGGYFAMGDSPVFNVAAASVPSVISANLTLRDAAPGGIVFNVARGTAAADLNVTGGILNAGSGNISKNGTGIMVLAGNNTYIGSTIISGGVLQVDSYTSTNNVTVESGATLSGTGTVNGATTIQSGGALSPGDSGPGILAFAKTLNLNSGSKTLLGVGKNGLFTTNSQVLVSGTLTCGGSLIVSNLGGAYRVGDKFTLFNATTFAGNFFSVNLPVLGGGLGWSNSLSSHGSIQVIQAVNLTPTNMVTSVSGNALTLSWPADHTGWTLEAQTNSQFSGIGTNWFPVANSTETNSVTITVAPSQPAVFYRLIY